MFKRKEVFPLDQKHDAPACEYLFVHEDKVDHVLSELPQDEQLYDLADLFRMFGDTTRIASAARARPCFTRSTTTTSVRSLRSAWSTFPNNLTFDI